MVALLNADNPQPGVDCLDGGGGNNPVDARGGPPPTKIANVCFCAMIYPAIVLPLATKPKIRRKAADAMVRPRFQPATEPGVWNG